MAEIDTKRRKKSFLSPNIFIFGFFFVSLCANLFCARVRVNR